MKYHLAVKKINILKYIVISKQPFLSLDVANPIEKNHIFFFTFPCYLIGENVES